MRNHSQTRRKRARRDGGSNTPSPGRTPPGAKKTDRKPASRSIPLDGYEEKSCAAATNERNRTVQMAQVPRGQTPIVRRTDATRPAQTSRLSAALELENQSSDGICQSAVRVGVLPTAWNRSEAGRIPRGPMSPWIWAASEKKAEKKMTPRPRSQRKRGHSISGSRPDRGGS